MAAGSVADVAKAIEFGLAKLIGLVINLFAKLIGLGGLAKKVQAIFGKIRKRIDKAVNKLLKKAQKAGRKLMRMLGIGGKKGKKGKEERSKKEMEVDLKMGINEGTTYVKSTEGNLFVQYSHGRYGYWRYNFRNQNSDFILIGYDGSSNSGPIVNRSTSINFITKKKILKENINEDPEQITGDEIFKETKKNISITKQIKLSEVKDFDELDFSEL